MRARLVAILAISAAVAAAGCTGTADPDADGTRSPSPPVPSAPTAVPEAQDVTLPRLERLVSTTLQIEGAPAALVASPGALWVQQHRGYELTRVDTRRGIVSDRVDVGIAGCGDLVWEAGSVWVTGCAITPGLVQVDGATTELAETINLSGLASSSSHEIWMSHLDDGVGQLRRIDADDVDQGRMVPVPGLLEDGSVAVAAGSIWVADAGIGLVYQLDPTSEEVLGVTPMPVPPDTSYLIEHDGAAWYVDASIGVLVRIDPDDGSTRLLDVRTEKPSEYWGAAASTAPGPPGRLWVRSGDEAWLVDTRRDQVLRRIALLDGSGGDVQQIGGSLWVSSFATNQVQRIEL